MSIPEQLSLQEERRGGIGHALPMRLLSLDPDPPIRRAGSLALTLFFDSRLASTDEEVEQIEVDGGGPSCSPFCISDA